MELLSYFLDNLWLGKPVWMWLTFVGIVIVLLALVLMEPYDYTADHRDTTSFLSLFLIDQLFFDLLYNFQ